MRKSASKSPKKRPLDQWQIDDAERLKDLWKNGPLLPDGKRLTQGAFGLKHGLGGQAGTWQYLNAAIALNLKAAMAFATEIGCKVADFSPTLGEHLKLMRSIDELNDGTIETALRERAFQVAQNWLQLREPLRGQWADALRAAADVVRGKPAAEDGRVEAAGFKAPGISSKAARHKRVSQ